MKPLLSFAIIMAVLRAIHYSPGPALAQERSIGNSALKSTDCPRIAAQIAKASGGQFEQTEDKFFVFSQPGFNLECPSNDKGGLEIELLRQPAATKELIDLAIAVSHGISETPPSRAVLSKAFYDCLDLSKLKGIRPYFEYEMSRFECFSNPDPHIFIKLLISDVTIVD
jgi:hypothetical protein